jgi:hypothetical protein
MIVKAAELKIPPKDPFKNDCLSRRAAAETLTRFISAPTAPFVLSLNSSFGTGKTTFVRMWRQHLKNEGFTTLYFNSWKNDFTALAQHESKHENLMDKALKAGKAMGKAAAPALVKLVTAGLIDGEAIEAAVSDAGAKLVEERIKTYEADKQTIEEFKAELHEFVKREGRSKPVVFFIDELDRCRPLFAIEVLEHAKHLFDVPGLVFVVSVDRTQLGHSIGCVYGTEMDVNGYLRRFIDLEFQLPTPNIREFVRAQRQRFSMDKFAFSHEGMYSEGWQSDIENALIISSRIYALRLRDVEHVITRLLLAMRLLSDSVNLGVLTWLICMRVAHPDYYSSYIIGQSRVDPFADNWAAALNAKSNRERHAARVLHVVWQVLPLSHEKLLAWVKDRDAKASQPAASLADDREDLKERYRFEAEIAKEILFRNCQAKALLLNTLELSQSFTFNED